MCTQAKATVINEVVGAQAQPTLGPDSSQIQSGKGVSQVVNTLPPPVCEDGRAGTRPVVPVVDAHLVYSHNVPRAQSMVTLVPEAYDAMVAMPCETLNVHGVRLRGPDGSPELDLDSVPVLRINTEAMVYDKPDTTSFEFISVIPSFDCLPGAVRVVLSQVRPLFPKLGINVVGVTLLSLGDLPYLVDLLSTCGDVSYSMSLSSHM